MTKITVFTKYGGGEILPYELKMSKCLSNIGKKIEIDPEIQLHIELRIDGELFKYDDVAGCSHLRFMKKKNVIANTITLTSELFEKFTNNEMINFLEEQIILAISQMLDRLKKEFFSLDKEGILSLLKKELKNIDY